MDVEFDKNIIYFDSLIGLPQPSTMEQTTTEQSLEQEENTAGEARDDKMELLTVPTFGHEPVVLGKPNI